MYCVSASSERCHMRKMLGFKSGPPCKNSPRPNSSSDSKKESRWAPSESQCLLPVHGEFPHVASLPAACFDESQDSIPEYVADAALGRHHADSSLVANRVRVWGRGGAARFFVSVRHGPCPLIFMNHPCDMIPISINGADGSVCFSRMVSKKCSRRTCLWSCGRRPYNLALAR